MTLSDSKLHQTYYNRFTFLFERLFVRERKKQNNNKRHIDNSLMTSQN